MKKLLIFCLALLILAPLIYFGVRFSKNPTSIAPYPFIFQKNLYQDQDADAPILIVGDRMAHRLATFAKSLSTKISGNIKKPIAIKTLATNGEGLHRTLHRIKQLPRLPFIIIYLGNLDNDIELKFNNKDMKTILSNLNRYYHPLIKSAVMLLPPLSRLTYETVGHIKIGNEVEEDKFLLMKNDSVFQKRMEVNYKLYEAIIDDFFNYARKANSVIIPVTSPLNLKIKPKKSCYGSFDESTHQDYKMVISLIQKKDYKAAYNLSKDLVLINASHASSQYLHGHICEKLNRHKEAQYHYEQAMAYDCQNNRGQPVYNAILKKASNKNGLIYLDYHQYLTDQSQVNHTFIEEIYPQDFYLEKLTDMLAIRIKKLLKLN